MGSAVAPSVANLFMATFENELILVNSNPYRQDIFVYLRFIDDIFIVFQEHSRFEDFCLWLNELNVCGLMTPSRMA